MEAAKTAPWRTATRRGLWFVLWVLISWCVLLWTHEAGHLVCGWLSGAEVVQFDLAPWRMPYSLFAANPHPLVTLWGGPLVGAGLPVGVALCCRRPEVWFLAAFCSLGNGLYLATGWVAGDRYLDTPQLFDAGAQPLHVLVYCTITISWGYLRLRRECLRLLAVELAPFPKPSQDACEREH